MDIRKYECAEKSTYQAVERRIGNCLFNCALHHADFAKCALPGAVPPIHLSFGLCFGLCFGLGLLFGDISPFGHFLDWELGRRRQEACCLMVFRGVVHLENSWWDDVEGK